MTTHGYQYVVLRCVPDVTREEFVNVGVVLYSQLGEFIDGAFEVDDARLAALSPDTDADEVRREVEILCRVVRGEDAPGRPSFERPVQRFGWVSAPRSTVIQPGPVHGGLTHDPAAELARLLGRLVGTGTPSP